MYCQLHQNYPINTHCIDRIMTFHFRWLYWSNHFQKSSELLKIGQGNEGFNFVRFCRWSLNKWSYGRKKGMHIKSNKMNKELNKRIKHWSFVQLTMATISNSLMILHPVIQMLQPFSVDVSFEFQVDNVLHTSTLVRQTSIVVVVANYFVDESRIP